MTDNPEVPTFVILREDGRSIDGEHEYYLGHGQEGMASWGHVDEYDGDEKPVRYLRYPVSRMSFETMTVYPSGWCKTHDQYVGVCEDEVNLEGECEEA